MRNFIKGSSLLAGCAIIAVAAPAHAQQVAQAAETDASNAEIVVTAQNRTQNVNDVPIAINVISGEELKKAGFSTLNDIDKIAPVVQLNQDQGTVKVTVRGVGTTSNDEAQDTSVVINIDGEYINRPNVMGMSLFDMDRVEVLRGPQGTLYGRNSTGGAINFITRKPGREFGAEGTISYGNYNAVRADAGVDVPLGDVAAVRVSGFYEDRDGYNKHPAGGGFFVFPAYAAGRSDDNNAYGGRVSLRLDPTDKLSVNLAAEYAQRKFSPGIFAVADLNGAGNGPSGGTCNNGFSRVAPAYAQLLCVPSNTNLLSKVDRNEYAAPLYGIGLVKQDTWAIRGRIAYEFSDAATLTYIGGYRSFSGDPKNRLTLPVIYQSFSFQDEADTQSHELRLNGKIGGVIYQIGGFYFKEKQDRENGFFLGPIAPPAGTYLSYFGRKISSESKSLFGQIEVPLGDKLTAVGGLRYTDNSRDALYINGSPFAKFKADGVTFDPTGPNFTLLGAGPGRKDLNAINAQKLPLGSNDNKVTWLAGLNFKPNSDTLVYVKASTGFKGGGFDAVGTYKPETNTAFEGGWKQTFGDHRQHQFNLGAFYYDYKDLQVSVLLDTTVGGQTFNAGKAKIWGIEASGSIQLDDATNFHTSINYLNAEYKELFAQFNVLDTSGALNGIGDLDPTTPGIQQPNFAGNRPPFSPEFIITAGLDHTFQLGDAGTLTARADSTFKSSYFTDFYNYADGTQQAFTQSDLSLEYQTASKRISVMGFVKNLENNRPLTYGSFVSAGPDDVFNWQFGTPRTYGIRLNVKF
ncbi:TonB-dependent receptor [Novosphingobium sp. PASSN1]|uniref:TonB-dependent receptor n=1 Tax=Novosphingobium sp. PASSN1 TaxID=2015561 RepID=UPI000BC47493|nr:TonB-dependent receptor [Novosphingobium sp. PASSN1]OYU35407.1 MAG: TonB-dependent receptor [Novosphingobium sp. PASSN1]